MPDLQEVRGRLARCDERVAAQRERLRKIHRAGNNPVLAEMILAELERNLALTSSVLVHRLADEAREHGR